MNAMLVHAKKHQILPHYLHDHIAITKKGSNNTLKESKTALINDFAEEFNNREIDILKLMKNGESNKDIADTLFLSVNTVRWYASRIFSKLDVKRRGEAVVHAKNYGLI